MTADEKKFLKSKGKRIESAPLPSTDELLEAQKEWGREGMRRRWGDHGPTKTVRAYTRVVDRFRAFVPNERDRADVASEALTEYLDKRGAATPEQITISAVLTHHWYDEILAGRKRTEYREITDYWTARLWAEGVTEKIAAITFSRGYTNTRMTWEVTQIDRNDEEGVYEIHLGKRIS